MIAQIRPPQSPRDPPPLVRARRMVASALLGRRRQRPSAGVRRLPAWKVWLWIASMLAVIAACGGHLLGVW